MSDLKYEQSMSDVFIFFQHNILPHFHRHIELKFVYTGVLEMMLDGHRRTLHAGEGILIFPFQTHAYFANNDTRVARILLSVDRVKSYLPIFSDFVPTDGVFDCKAVGGGIDTLAHMIRNTLENRTELSNDIATSLFISACGILLERLRMVRIDRSPGTNRETFSKIFDWCARHYREPIKLGELADALFISERQLSRIFSEQLHIGFRAYINSLRVQHAVELLARPDKPITELAFECGFESISSFNRVFRDTMNHTPSEFRAQLMKSDARIPPDYLPKVTTVDMSKPKTVGGSLYDCTDTEIVCK